MKDIECLIKRIKFSNYRVFSDEYYIKEFRNLLNDIKFDLVFAPDVKLDCIVKTMKCLDHELFCKDRVCNFKMFLGISKYILSDENISEINFIKNVFEISRYFDFREVDLLKKKDYMYSFFNSENYKFVEESRDVNIKYVLFVLEQIYLFILENNLYSVYKIHPLVFVNIYLLIKFGFLRNFVYYSREYPVSVSRRNILDGEFDVDVKSILSYEMLPCFLEFLHEYSKKEIVNYDSVVFDVFYTYCKKFVHLGDDVFNYKCLAYVFVKLSSIFVYIDSMKEVYKDSSSLCAINSDFFSGVFNLYKNGVIKLDTFDRVMKRNELFFESLFSRFFKDDSFELSDGDNLSVVIKIYEKLLGSLIKMNGEKFDEFIGDIEYIFDRFGKVIFFMKNFDLLEKSLENFEDIFFVKRALNFVFFVNRSNVL